MGKCLLLLRRRRLGGSRRGRGGRRCGSGCGVEPPEPEWSLRRRRGHRRGGRGRQLRGTFDAAHHRAGAARPQTASSSASDMNAAARPAVTLVSTVAPARAPNTAWLRAAAEGVGDVAALALLQQDHDHQQQADEDVQRDEQVIQHRSLCQAPGGAANPEYTRLRPCRATSGRLRLRPPEATGRRDPDRIAPVTISANAATSRLAPPTSAPSTSGWAHSAAMLSGFTLPP